MKNLSCANSDLQKANSKSVPDIVSELQKELEESRERDAERRGLTISSGSQKVRCDNESNCNLPEKKRGNGRFTEVRAVFMPTACFSYNSKLVQNFQRLAFQVQYKKNFPGLFESACPIPVCPVPLRPAIKERRKFVKFVCFISYQSHRNKRKSNIGNSPIRRCV